VLHYRYCASSLFHYIFTYGSSTCVALRGASNNLTVHIVTFLGLILNAMVTALVAAQTINFDKPQPQMQPQPPPQPETLAPQRSSDAPYY
jgi:hypothetical protein